MSGPSAQTSPDTERGSRQDENTQKTSPTRPKKKNWRRKNIPSGKTPTRKLGKTAKVENNLPEPRKTARNEMSSGAEKLKSAIHGWASKFVYVTLDPPCKRPSKVNLQTPRTSYSSRRSRVARRRTRKLDRSRVVQKSNKIYSIRWRSRADFPEPPQTVHALVPKAGSVWMHGVAVSAKPIGVRYAAIAGRQKELAVNPRKLQLCHATSHPAVQAVGRAVLVPGAGPVAQNFVPRELTVHFPFPVWSGESSPMRLVHHRDDATSTSDLLVSSSFIPLRVVERQSCVAGGTQKTSHHPSTAVALLHIMSCM